MNRSKNGPVAPSARNQLVAGGDHVVGRHHRAEVDRAAVVAVLQHLVDQLGAESAHERDSMFEDVYKEMPWHLKRQSEEQGA